MTNFLQKMRAMGKEFYALSAMLFFFFVSWAGCFSLLAVWLKDYFAMTGAQIGTAYAIFSITALCLAPFYGAIQDRLILRRHLIVFLGVLMTLCAPIYIGVIEPLLKQSIILGSVVLGLYMGFTFMAGIGVLESYTERFGRIAKFEFAHARMFGTLGWASTVAITGILINLDPHYNFYLSTIGGLVFLFCLYCLKNAATLSDKMLEEYKRHNNQKVSWQEIKSLFAMKGFWAVLLWVSGSSMYGVYDQQFMNYFVDKFADRAEGTTLYGLLNSTQVFLEAACTFFAPFIVNKIGAKNGLLLASTVMFTRIGLSGLVDSPLAISAVKLLHAPEVPLVIVSVFKYITTRFNPALSSTLYLLAFVMISQIMSATLAPVIGMFYDTIGFAHTYLVMASYVVCTTILSIFTLSNRAIYSNDDNK